MESVIKQSKYMFFQNILRDPPGMACCLLHRGCSRCEESKKMILSLGTTRKIPCIASCIMKWALVTKYLFKLLSGQREENAFFPFFRTYKLPESAGHVKFKEMWGFTSFNCSWHIAYAWRERPSEENHVAIFINWTEKGYQVSSNQLDIVISNNRCHRNKVVLQYSSIGLFHDTCHSLSVDEQPPSHTKDIPMYYFLRNHLVHNAISHIYGRLLYQYNLPLPHFLNRFYVSKARAILELTKLLKNLLHISGERRNLSVTFALSVRRKRRIKLLQLEPNTSLRHLLKERLRKI